MVRPLQAPKGWSPSVDSCPLSLSQMAATAIVVLFSGLSAASSGANGSLGGMLAMLSAMR